MTGIDKISEASASVGRGNDSSRITPEFIAQLIINHDVINGFGGGGATRDDIEHVRDPILLAERILIAPTGMRDSSNLEQKNLYFKAVLDYILVHEKVNQVHYKDEYHAALDSVIKYYNSLTPEQQRSFFGDIPNTHIWRPYDISHLQQSLDILDSVWSPTNIILLPAEHLSLTNSGHGIGVTHDAEKEQLEKIDLQNGANLVNELLQKRLRMTEEHFRTIHYVISKNTTVLDPLKQEKRPINPGYRNHDASRDLKQYPPFLAKYVEMSTFYARYKITPPEPDESKQPQILLQELRAEESRTADARLKESADLTAMRAAQAKLENTTTGRNTFEGVTALPELHLLMNKYFLWFNQVMDEMDSVYKGCRDKSLPVYKNQKHPAVFFAAQAFNRLINIHPCENGNTRAGSYAIINFILPFYGYPPFILNEKNQKAFFNIERFGRFNMDIYEGETSRDISKWSNPQNADFELAALIAHEIGLK